MAVVEGSGVYDSNAANTNRTVRFRVAVQAGVSTAFVFLRGNQAHFPHTGQVTSPTVNQRIAQERADAIRQALTIYAPLVGFKIIDFNQGGSETANALVLEFETLVSNVLPSVSDITDTLGVVGSAKTKSGLQTIATALLASASLDNGGTLLFGANPNLADGTASTAAQITSLTVAAID